MVNDYLHSEEVIIVCECDNNSGVRLVLTFKRIIQIIPESGEMNRSRLSFQSKNTSEMMNLFNKEPLSVAIISSKQSDQVRRREKLFAFYLWEIGRASCRERV